MGEGAAKFLDKKTLFWYVAFTPLESPSIYAGGGINRKH